MFNVKVTNSKNVVLAVFTNVKAKSSSEALALVKKSRTYLAPVNYSTF